MTKSILTSTIVSLIALSLAIGCDPHDHDHGHSPTTGATAHDDHDHDHGHAHDHGGEKIPLDEMVQAGPYEVTAVQNGTLAPGGEVNYDVEILGEPRPKSVRFWLGVASAAAEAKVAPQETEKTVYHVDLAVPAEVSEATKLWVEIETASGETVRAALTPKS